MTFRCVSVSFPLWNICSTYRMLSTNLEHRTIIYSQARNSLKMNLFVQVEMHRYDKGEKNWIFMTLKRKPFKFHRLFMCDFICKEKIKVFESSNF